MTQTELPEDLRGALVAAVDDSSSAREALRFAARLAEEGGKPLHVVTVWNFVNGQAPDQPADTPPSEQAWQQEAERGLAALLAQELATASGVRSTVLHGNTGPTLLEVSRVADHLVVGSRGRGGVAGLLLGSTSEELVRHGGCPITVVREGSTTS